MIVAAVVVGQGIVEMQRFRVPPPFPSQSETYTRAVDLVFRFPDGVIYQIGVGATP